MGCVPSVASALAKGASVRANCSESQADIYSDGTVRYPPAEPCSGAIGIHRCVPSEKFACRSPGWRWFRSAAVRNPAGGMRANRAATVKGLRKRKAEAHAAGNGLAACVGPVAVPDARHSTCRRGAFADLIAACRSKWHFHGQPYVAPRDIVGDLGLRCSIRRDLGP